MTGDTDICIYAQDDLEDETIEQIARLKRQWWHYPLDEQIKYLKNLPSEDQHIVCLNRHRVAAYLRLTPRSAKINNIIFKIAGLSTVCSDKAQQKKGFGRRIVREASRLIEREHFDFGLVQCDDGFVDFYLKCGWHRSKCDFYVVNDAGRRQAIFREKNVLMYPLKDFRGKEIEIVGDSF